MRETPIPTRCGALRRLAALACLLAPFGAGAQVERISVSPDVSVDLSGGSGALTHDEDVAIDDLLGGGFLGLEPLGSLPAAADLSAFHVRTNGDALFSFDTTQSLPNGLVAEPGDVVRFDGVTWFLEFDASASGVPNGVRVDAVTEVAGQLAVSFDTSVDLAGIYVDDEDLVETGGAMVFDGSAAGVSRDLDLDAAHALEGGSLVLSFDGSGEVGGIVFDDEDLVEFDAAGGSWSLVYDGSAQHAGWRGGDLDAVRVLPEPGSGLGVGAGFALVAALRRRRTRPSLEPGNPAAESPGTALQRTRP